MGQRRARRRGEAGGAGARAPDAGGGDGAARGHRRAQRGASGAGVCGRGGDRREDALLVRRRQAAPRADVSALRDADDDRLRAVAGAG